MSLCASSCPKAQAAQHTKTRELRGGEAPFFLCAEQLSLGAILEAEDGHVILNSCICLRHIG